MVGILATSVHTTRKMIALINEIRDAPKDISDLRSELENLGLLLQSTRERIDGNKLRQEDVMIARTLTQCTEQCEASMESLRLVIAPYAAGGSASRGPMKRVSWMFRKDEVKSLMARLRDSKASLQFTVTILVQ